MDSVTRAFFELKFRLAFAEMTGNEFQDLFASIMEKRYPADFIRVRPWGNVGDRKNDGYLRSERTLFQSYAPNDMSAAECINKIDEDFNGALPFWREHFDTWVFVHNSKQGLGPQQTAKLLALDAAHAPLRTTSWGYEELRQRVFGLAEAELASLFGPAPSQQSMLAIGFADLEPVLEQVAVLQPAAAPDLRPVPATKLHYNMLSSDAETLLRAGMARADLVRRYFRAPKNQRFHDGIAEAFRTRYAELRESGANPDTVFVKLQQFAGGNQLGSAARQNAVLAVLSFLFEECDIFERPPEGGDAT